MAPLQFENWGKLDISTSMFKLKTPNIDADILALTAKMDEFKVAWRAGRACTPATASAV